MKRIRRRRFRGAYNRAAHRRREIEKHAIRMQAASTDDFDRWLVVWAQHNGQSKYPVDALILASRRMGRELSEAEAIAIINEAKASPKPRKADGGPPNRPDLSRP